MLVMKNPSRCVSLLKLAAIIASTVVIPMLLLATPSYFIRYKLDQSYFFRYQREVSQEGALSSTTDVNKAVDEGKAVDAFNPVLLSLEKANATNHMQSNVHAVDLNNYLPNAYLYSHLDKPYNKSVLAFVHNPKSGGSSMKQCIKRLYRSMQKDEPVLLSLETTADEKEKLLNHVTAPNDYYMGDYTMGICDSFEGRPCSYFTLVREPYERIISHYYFCKNGGEGCPEYVSTIEEFSLSVCSLFFRQLTARFFCTKDAQNTTAPWKCERNENSIDHLPPNQQNRGALLKYFLENIDKMFAVVGLTEEFDTSLKLFEGVFGEPFHKLCQDKHANAGNYNKHDITNLYNKTNFREGIISETKEMLMKNDQIRQCLNEDVQLYRKMYDIFQKQKQFAKV